MRFLSLSPVRNEPEGREKRVGKARHNFGECSPGSAGIPAGVFDVECPAGKDASGPRFMSRGAF
jgi:hypothetical protein